MRAATLRPGAEASSLRFRPLPWTASGPKQLRSLIPTIYVYFRKFHPCVSCEILKAAVNHSNRKDAFSEQVDQTQRFRQKSCARPPIRSVPYAYASGFSTFGEVAGVFPASALQNLESGFRSNRLIDSGKKVMSPKSKRSHAPMCPTSL